MFVFIRKQALIGLGDAAVKQENEQTQELAQEICQEGKTYKSSNCKTESNYAVFDIYQICISLSILSIILFGFNFKSRLKHFWSWWT